MCFSSNSKIVFPCKICNTNIEDKDSAVQCAHLSILDSYEM